MMRNNTSKYQKSSCPLTTSKRKRSAAKKLAATVKESLPPGLSQPTLRALAAAGYSSLDQFTKIKAAELAKLHGMGPKGIEIIRSALKSNGKSFLP